MYRIREKHNHTLWSLQSCPKVDSVFLTFSFRLVTSFPSSKARVGGDALKGTPTASGPSFLLPTAWFLSRCSASYFQSRPGCSRGNRKVEGTVLPPRNDL